MAILRDYIKIKHGFAFKGTNITSNDNGIVLVTPGNFAIGGGFKEDKCKYFNGEIPNEYILKADDLIVTMTDLSKAIDTLGYGALIPKSERVYLHNQRIGLVSFISKELDKHYLYWFMRTAHYQKTIAATSSGSTVHHTSPDRIMDIEIDLPDIYEQKKIADFLDNIEEKIYTNIKINKNLEQQAVAVFNKFYDTSTNQQPFTTLINVLGGGTPKTGNPEFWDGSIPFFTPKDVGTPYTFKTEKYITELGLKHCNSRLYPTNTTFVTARGTVGKISLAGAPMAMNQSCYALTSDIVDPLLVYFYVLKAVNALKHKASGAVFDAIVTRDFDGEIINILSDADSEAALSIIKPMMEAIHNNSKENMRLSAVRDTLLPKLMSGELDVSDLDL